VKAKYNFSQLFSKAWLKSLLPHNLISGFKNCGVYPFDSTAIKTADEPQPDTYQSDASEPGNSANPTVSTNLEQSFPSLFEITDELRKKFERRRSEGYDLPDPLYQKWLDTNYPESVSICEHFPDAHVLSPVPISTTVESTTPPAKQQISNSSCNKRNNYQITIPITRHMYGNTQNKTNIIYTCYHHG